MNFEVLNREIARERNYFDQKKKSNSILRFFKVFYMKKLPCKTCWDTLYLHVIGCKFTMGHFFGQIIFLKFSRVKFFVKIP